MALPLFAPAIHNVCCERVSFPPAFSESTGTQGGINGVGVIADMILAVQQRPQLREMPISGASTLICRPHRAFPEMSEKADHGRPDARFR